MVGQFAGGQWVSGSRLLGDRPCGRGYYKLKEEAPLFENRELAEEYARKLAIESVQANFETELYLADLDKKSPWKNTPTPILNPVTFEIK